MLIFVYGENSYFAQRKIQDIVGSAQRAHQNGLFLRYIDCGAEDMERVISEMLQPEIMPRRRITELKYIFRSGEIKERILQIRQS